MELLFPIQDHLSSAQASSLLEAGLTFILYQRGQIPLPFQQLQASATEVKRRHNGFDNVDNPESGCIKNDSTPASCPGSSCFQKASFGGECESLQLNARKRISNLIRERKRRLRVQKMEKQERMNLEIESKAYHAILPALGIIEKLLTDVALAGSNDHVSLPRQRRLKIVSVALMLGPSVYSPRETYYFDLQISNSEKRNEVAVTPDVISSEEAEIQFQRTVLRQFYKRLISNPDLSNFTSKSLKKTCAHICIISSGDLKSILADNASYKNITRMPSLPPSVSILCKPHACESIDPSTPTGHPVLFSSYDHKIRNKCFVFKIQEDNLKQGLGVSLEEQENVNESSDFSSDILFDNNSFSCYQIPLRFKGVQCKNKRM